MHSFAAKFLISFLICDPLVTDFHGCLVRGVAPNPESGWFGPGHDIKVYKFLYDGAALGAYVNSKNDDTYYALYLNNVIREWNLSKPERQEIGSWLLVRWQHEYVEPEILTRWQEYIGDRPELTYSAVTSPNSLGCLAMSPLRYGDLDGDGVKELVLFLDNDLLMFSPEKQQTIFSAPLELDDWLTTEETQEHFARVGTGGVREVPQYQSQITAQSVTGWMGGRAGYRGYAKLYFSDFNEDGVRDIVVWRKLYKSHLRNEDPQGFRLVNETFLHYSLVGGEYLPHDTAPSDIEAWLANNELTWTDGYPNLSECAGEEGQLIAEMHDPLLNDPEVLPPAPSP